MSPLGDGVGHDGGFDRRRKTGDDQVELRVGDHERRSQEDRVAIDAVGVAGTGVDQETPLAGRPNDALGDPCSPWEWFPAASIGDELEADQQTAAPDLADVRIVAEPDLEAGHQALALRGARLDEVLRLEDAQDLARDRGGHRAVRVGESVDEPEPPCTVPWTSSDAATKPNGQ